MRGIAIFFALTAGALAAPKGTKAPKPVPPATPAPVEGQTPLKQALAAMQKGDLTTARSGLEKILKATPDDPGALLNLGIIDYRQKNYASAETLLEHAVRVDPASAQAWLILGVVRQDQDKLDGALAALAQAVYLDPKNARAHHYLGVTIGRRGWYSGAEDEMRKAIELQPDYLEAHFNLAVFYLQRNPPAVELARRHYQKALDLGGAPDPEIAKALGEP